MRLPSEDSPKGAQTRSRTQVCLPHSRHSQTYALCAHTSNTKHQEMAPCLLPAACAHILSPGTVRPGCGSWDWAKRSTPTPLAAPGGCLAETAKLEPQGRGGDCCRGRGTRKARIGGALGQIGMLRAMGGCRPGSLVPTQQSQSHRERQAELRGGGVVPRAGGWGVGDPDSSADSAPNW